jgi:acetyl-CoA carboxylase biotin carboxylase subunit
MITKLLIANRGEIAVRIIRAAREMGIKTVVVYSEVDKDSLPVKIADKAVKIGPASPTDSYLFYQNILAAALAVKADAIHPGYGFLAENASFAEACRALNIKFVGPNPLSIRKLGDKITAKKIVKEAGVPVVPGSDGVIKNFEQAKKIIDKIGYPVIIKASAGGGGRGMRIVYKESDFENAFNYATTEAQQAFGDSSVYIEKFIGNPKHIEIQILADKHGNAIHLYERDCSLQRRHQKLLEETPSPVIDDETRMKMGDVAVKAAKAANYDSAGTVEFLYDIETGGYYFIEMNTRIQVEHPITEEITGIDLIKYQIRIANGEKLDISQEDVPSFGHCIECRINAEDPDRGFTPNPGKITNFIVPGGPGIRVDSGVFCGYTIPPYYDSMVAKLIVWGKNRKEAINRMKRALGEFIIEGVKTTIPFHEEVMKSKAFLSGQYTTNFVEKFFK